jgi:hypothetical protein
MKKIGSAFAAVVALALIGAQAHGQVRPPGGERLDLFLEALRPQSAVAGGPAMAVSQTQLERLLRILPPVSVGHGRGAPALAQSQQATMPSPDPSIYGFCYESCKTARAIGSCGTPAPGASDSAHGSGVSGQHDEPCAAVEDTRTLEAIAGPRLGTGRSPFVDDNTGPDGTQPAGYTFFGQFIDHDVTRTTTALSALAQLNQLAHADASVQAKPAAAGITTAQLSQAIADPVAPGSALSANTGKLDIDSVYSVADFADLTGISAPWFTQQNGAYTGYFAQVHVQAPSSASVPTVIDGLDYERTSTGSAQIPDPRNSEHKILAQIQNLFELAHNDCMDHALAGISAPGQSQIGSAFDACHHKVIWTYETIVATDFIPRIADQRALGRITGGALSTYTRGTTATSILPSPGAVHTYLYSCKPGSGADATIQIPHEFAVAGFRLGHSLIRDDYVLHDIVTNAAGNVLTGQQRPIFAIGSEPETLGLVGDNPVQPGDVIDWSYFFDTSDQTAQPSRPLDTLISDRLFSLPIAALPPGPDVNGKDTSTERNLPRRNILRASEPTPVLTGSVALATGEEAEDYAQQRIPGFYDATAQVRALLATRLSSQGFDPNYLSPLTPLWLFVLAEAETTESSQRLGQLGSHIVAEFLVGSLRCDEGSVLYAAPANLHGWGPTATIAANHRYSMPELLAYLQADAKIGGQSIRLFSH